MPELPEVETIARALRDGGRLQPDGSLTPSILEKQVESASFLWPRTAASPPADEIERRLSKQTVRQVGRRGKFLTLGLDQDTLVFHLRMSGDLLVENCAAPAAPHHRFLMNFTDGQRLAFNDTRKFGRVWLARDPEEIFSSLGPEPLSPEFTPEILARILHSSHRQLKPLLLDQSKLAGMGNIYTDEALHRAGLHPTRLSSTLDEPQTLQLWSAIREVLQEAIQHQGSSIDWVYRGGDFQNTFRVYQRTGQPCLRCGQAIQRIVVGQRGTHFCPACQPANDTGLK
jgi:formamidopyrimidine-DNA glycosylase